MDTTTNRVTALLAITAACVAGPAAAQDVPFVPGNVPTSYALVDESAPGTVRLGLFGELLLEFDGGGSGAMVAGEPNVDPSMAWSVTTDGQLVLVPDAPLPTAGVAYDPACPGIAFDTVTTLDRLVVRRLAASAAADRLQTTSHTTTRYLDRNPGDACAAPAPLEQSGSVVRVGYRPGGELPLAATDLSGVITLPHRLGPVRPEWSAAQWSAALFDMRSGAVREGLGIGSTFTHALASGRLRVSARDAAGTPVNYEYRRLQRDYRGGDGLFAVATLADGRRAVSYDYAPRQGKVALPLSVLGTWQSGFSETSVDRNIQHSIEFSSAPTTSGPGLGARRTAQRDPVTGQWSYAATPFSWTMGSGLDIVMQTYRTATGQSVATCPGGTACTVQSARRLLVVSRSSDNTGIRAPTYVRLSVLETLQSDADGDGTLDVIDQRSNFYQRNLADAAM